MDSDAIHSASLAGFSVRTDSYVSGRPHYPQDVRDWLLAELDLGPGKRVLDLGAGSGKFTQPLAETRASVIAIEPSAAMRAAFTRRYPDLPCLAGTASSLPFTEGSFDTVACGQSFHWFSTAAALEEIRRILKPGGSLALVWNVRDETVPWVAALTDLVEPYAGDTPRFRDGTWRDLFPGHGFGPLRETHCTHSHSGPPARVIRDRILSISFIAALDDDTRQRVEADVQAIVDAEPELAGKAQVSFPYRTVMAWASAAA